MIDTIKRIFKAEKLKLIGSRILVRPDNPLERTKGGLYLPVSYEDDRITRGQVIQLGVKKSKKGIEIPFDVQVNDYVLYVPYSGVEVELNGEKLILLREEEIHSIIDN